jgi:hypothetical protein
MMLARWMIDARFGHKEDVLRLMTKWAEQIGAKVGWDSSNMRTLVGSIGVAESTIVNEVEIRDLAELNDAFAKLATVDGHAAWGKELEPHVVSGTNRWEIYRIQ